MRLAMPGKISLGYFVAGLTWITASEYALDVLLRPSTAVLFTVGTWEAFGFVIVTAVLLFGLLRRWALRMEAAGRDLAESERHYRGLFQANPLPMWIFDRKSLRFLAVNEAAIQQYGYSRAEFLSMAISDIRPPEDVPSLRAHVDQLRETAVARAGLWKHLRKDGTELEVEIIGHALSYEGRDAQLITVHDLTPLRRAEQELAESDASLRFLLGALDDVIWLSKPDSGQMLYISPNVERVFGRTVADFLGNPELWYTMVHPEDAERFATEYARLTVARSTAVQYRILRPDGEVRWLDARVAVVDDAAGRPLRAIGIVSDVTERHRADEELRLAAQVFEFAEEAIVITDPNERILRVNKSFTRVTGYTAEEAIGQTPRLLASGRHDAEFYSELWRALGQDGHWAGEVWNRRKNNELYPEWLSITRLRGRDGNPSHYVGIFADLSERKHSENRIHQLSNYDTLTNLPNRALLDDRLRQAVAAARRGEGDVALLCMDLDRFKLVNDSLGHAVGDVLLTEAGERLVAVADPEATVSRATGDQFIIVLPRSGGRAGAAAVATRILEALRAPFSLPTGELRLTGSIGISVYPDDGQDPDSLMKNAEAAMYHAKERGHDQHQFFTAALSAAVSERLQLENRLRVALDAGEFELHYQPQVQLDGTRADAVEALVRWRHPETGLVPPLRFIPVAEESGLIVPLGEWVLREACRQAAEWLGSHQPILVAVNISAVQFAQSDFAAVVARALADSDLPPHLLELEVTESVVMGGIDRVLPMLASLKALGVRLSVDDFGTGYSSLAYLRRFPIDKLKIDQGFVREMLNNTDDLSITRAVIDLARSLRLRVIAEGVETAEQADVLRGMGCDEAQGYHYSRPLQAPAVPAWFHERGNTPDRVLASDEQVA
jgi:diguanylate cyclase (GGDEF)-like protein/PAS domain S-box-containing protein